MRGHQQRIVRAATAVCVLIMAVSATSWADSSADGSEVTAAAKASSGDKMPDTSVVYSNLTVMRLNPLGLQNRFGLFWRKRLSDSDSVLKKNTYARAGVTAMLTPSLQRVGARVEVQPLAVLQLFAAADFVWFMGNFDYMTSYKSANVDYSEPPSPPPSGRTTPPPVCG